MFFIVLVKLLYLKFSFKTSFGLILKRKIIVLILKTYFKNNALNVFGILFKVIISGHF